MKKRNRKIHGYSRIILTPFLQLIEPLDKKFSKVTKALIKLKNIIIKKYLKKTKKTQKPNP